MLRRVISALAMIPILIGAILYPGVWLFQGLVVICIGTALYEYFCIVWASSPRSQRIFGTVLGIGYSLWWLLGVGEVIGGQVLVIILVMFGLFFFGLLAKTDGAHHRIGHLIFGVLYVAGLGVHIAFLRGLPDSLFWIFAVLAATWLNDTAAYFAGHLWGRHRLAPAISPGKTWEGWIGGIVGSAAGVFFFWWLLPNPLSPGEAALLVALASLFGPFGDLSESLIKRSVGVKDSGHMIPGHGGMLDRIDALLFNGPLFYYFAVFVAS